MDIGRPTQEEIKIWLCLAALVLAVAWPWLARRSARTAKRLLLALTVVAGLNYARWGPAMLLEAVDSYDLLHYYLAAKYFDELGYHDLYPALILIDHEHGPYNKRLRRYHAQDKEHGYRAHMPLSHALERGRELRDHVFSPQRWAQLERDFLVLQRERYDRMPRDLWITMMNDRGFNGTPVWLLAGEPLSHLFSVNAIKWLCGLDTLLLVIALIAVGRTYGTTTALWAASFLFLSYSLRWPVIGWAFLRYDWVAGLLLAMVLLRRGHPFWAGVVTAHAAMVRLFPAAWMFGPAAQGFAGLLRRGATWRERVNRRLVMLAAGFVLGAAVLQGAALARYGREAVETHIVNIAHHIKPEELSSRRLGFALATVFNGKVGPKYLPVSKKIAIKENARGRLVFALILLGVLGFGLRRQPVDEAFGFGLIPFFMLATASYYYYVARISLIVLHAADLTRLRNRLGLAFLLGLELFSNVAETVFPGRRVFLIGYLAWGVSLYCIAMAVWLVVEAPPRAAADATAPADQRAGVSRSRAMAIK